MEPNELITLLKEQESNLQNLISVAEKKQRALISNNYTALEDSILSEEKVLCAVHTTERGRVNIIKKFYIGYSKKSDSSKLCDFVTQFSAHLSEGKSEEITDYEKRLKQLIAKVSILNRQNIYLIEHARNFIKETLNIVASDRKKILDRKV